MSAYPNATAPASRNLDNPLATLKPTPTVTFMSDIDYDLALVSAAFAHGAEEGWHKVSAAAAARRAGLDLVAARENFAEPGAILLKFGELADRHALTGALQDGAVRDRLFDILLRRFDFLQMHRAGIIALLKSLPAHPALALLLARATLDSMGWLLEGAGEPAKGLAGEIKKRGLALVWAAGLRAWLSDASPDLTATMAAVDTALNRADALAARFSPAPKPAADDEAFTAPDSPSPASPTELT